METQSHKAPHQRNYEVIEVRQNEAYRLRVEGLYEYEIAEQLGISQPQAHRDIKAAAQRIPEQERREIRELAHRRMEHLYRGLRRRLDEEELNPVEHATVANATRQVVMDHVKLHGAAAAQKVDVTVHEVDATDLELAEMLRRADADAAEAELTMVDPD